MAVKDLNRSEPTDTVQDWFFASGKRTEILVDEVSASLWDMAYVGQVMTAFFLEASTLVFLGISKHYSILHT